MRDTFLMFGSPMIQEEEIQEVVATLRSGWIGTGPKVHQFEEMFREYTGARYAMALHSCTAALHLSMIAAGIGPGDEVITTPMTFAATANSIIHTGAQLVFVDIERSSMNIDPQKIREYIETHCEIDQKSGQPVNRQTRRTVKGVIPVHMAGRACRMDEIMEIAHNYHLYVIEDAAHAVEAKHKGQKVGNIGDLTCFSFYVTKNIVTGEGGMVTTNDEEFANRIKIYGLHGMSKDAWMRYSDKGFRHYQVLYPGFKYNMMDLQASLGIHQLKRVDKYLARRNEIWQAYDEAFAKLPLELPTPVNEDGSIHARHLYTPLLKTQEINLSRDELQQRLYEMRIGTGIHFVALHLHPYYQTCLGTKRGDYPNAEYISDRTISLPLSAKLTDEDVQDVIEAVRRILTNGR